jgi:CBS domain-containing protein
MKGSVDVNDYMVKGAVLVTPETELFEAIDQILRNRLSGVAVVDDNRHPVGMLSELDCLRVVLAGAYYGEGIGNSRVGEHMTTNVDCVKAHANIVDVAKSMLAHKRRRRPVVDEHNHVVGQITCRAILRCVRDFEGGAPWTQAMSR